MGGCCNGREGTNLEEAKKEKGKITEPIPMTLHVQSKSAPHHLLKIYQIIAKSWKFNLQVKETPDLSTVKAIIRRYPLAECESIVIVGDRVIPRFMAQRSGIYPKSAEDAYLYDSLIDQICDMYTGMITPNPQLGPAPEAQSSHFPAIEKRLPVGKNFFVGNTMTPADVFVFCFLDEYFLGATFKTQRGGMVPSRLTAFHAAFLASPEYKAYLESTR